MCSRQLRWCRTKKRRRPPAAPARIRSFTVAPVSTPPLQQLEFGLDERHPPVAPDLGVQEGLRRLRPAGGEAGECLGSLHHVARRAAGIVTAVRASRAVRSGRAIRSEAPRTSSIAWLG